MSDSTQRFSSRVDNYVQYRPSYPAAIVPLLARECGLTPQAVIADIGSGTGLLAVLWLQHGNPVFGVEPNAPMRAAGARLLAGYPAFTSIAGTAEATTLPSASVDFVTAGQAFHWFDPPAARQEFLRILRPQGWSVLVGNARRTDSTPFLVGYEQLLHEYAPGYTTQAHERADARTPNIVTLFGSPDFRVATFENQQWFDWAGIQGRLLSSSYAPEPATPAHAPMIAALQRLFDTYAQAGQVAFAYETAVYYGRLQR
ncbi:MAG: class I SAM-dependent methyltransferase [Chloroflexota bacterium]|nr:class I SAM-dependent methyltransferase [Chloroflexota bacterium]